MPRLMFSELSATAALIYSFYFFSFNYIVLLNLLIACYQSFIKKAPLKRRFKNKLQFYSLISIPIPTQGRFGAARDLIG